MTNNEIRKKKKEKRKKKVAMRYTPRFVEVVCQDRRSTNQKRREKKKREKIDARVCRGRPA